jgi:hypothetical protein
VRALEPGGPPAAARPRADGEASWLRGAGSPPLGVWGPDRRRPMSVAPLAGSTIALFTDGLVERRDRPLLRDGLDALVEAGGRHLHRDVEALADALLDELGSDAQAPDDRAIVVARPGD